MAQSLREHITARPTWTRLLYMILFVVAFNLAELIIVFTVLLQFLSKLFSGKYIDQLSTLGEGLSLYLAQIIRFLTYSSEVMPYPLGNWPTTAHKAKAPQRTKVTRRKSRTTAKGQTINSK